MLLGFAAIHLVLSITILLVGNIYAFTDKYSITWLPNLLVSLLLLLLLSKEKMESKFVNVMLFVYPLALVVISVIIYSHLPQFTYKDATAIVLQETFERIDYTKQNKIK